MDLFTVSYKHFAQDMTLENWYSDGLTTRSKFFYLLIWEKEKKFVKFGYKVGLKQFKDDYARLHHHTPDYSHIWRVKFQAPFESVLGISHTIDSALNQFIYLFENSTHRKIKKLETVKRMPKVQEYYQTKKFSALVDFINTEVAEIENTFFEFQISGEDWAASHLRNWVKRNRKG